MTSNAIVIAEVCSRRVGLGVILPDWKASAACSLHELSQFFTLTSVDSACEHYSNSSSLRAVDYFFILVKLII